MLSKERMKLYQRSRRKRYPAQDKAYNDKLTKYRTELKIKLVQHKGGKCNRCGNGYDPVVFDFHHIDPSKKDFNLASILMTATLSQLYAELDKTVMLCSNCHRLTHKEIGWCHAGKQGNTDQQLIW